MSPIFLIVLLLIGIKAAREQQASPIQEPQQQIFDPIDSPEISTTTNMAETALGIKAVKTKQVGRVVVLGGQLTTAKKGIPKAIL